MGRTAIALACLVLFAGVAAAQGDVAPESVDAALGGAGRSYNAGGPALNVISCAVDGSGNVASVGGATCSPGTVTAPIVPQAAITRVVAYRGARRSASTSTVNRLIARMEFYAGSTLAGACGNGPQTGASRSYSYSRGGATNLAALSTVRCRGSGIAFAGLRLGWTNQPFVPFRRPSPPPAPVPRPPPPPPVPSTTVAITVTSTYTNKPCTPANIAEVNNTVAAFYMASVPNSVFTTTTSCSVVPGRHLLQGATQYGTRGTGTSTNGQDISGASTGASVALSNNPQLINADSANAQSESVPASPSPSPVPSPSPSPAASPSPRPSPSPYGSQPNGGRRFFF